MLNINRQKLRSSREFIWFLLDFLMLGLLMVNMAFIIWDSIYSFVAIQNTLKEILPALQAAYQPIHENFIFYDLVFVAVFLTEFFVRWGHAAKTREYGRWYFYPFIHWYDLVGCIPIGGFRILRLLRVISIVHRLHRYGIIDITQYRAYQFINFYYEAFMEEISDRIVLKVISGIQCEAGRGSPLVSQIQQQVLYPRRKMISNWLSARVAKAAAESYVPNRGALRNYLEARVDHALQQNIELSRLKLLPVVGGTIARTLEDSVGDIVANIVHQILEDLASSANHAFIEDLVAAVLPNSESARKGHQANQALIEMIQEILEAVKTQVKVKRWRENLP
ncbi:hypothetical protein [Marinobacter sp. ELB17]|uniref:hypothetical protein n=1 Tax=Marinobacter sp. ELB17 TaxID=270374 RepID=UPI0002DC3811|nr:hypothetical protein [Marinobacter sp. ELB17]